MSWLAVILAVVKGIFSGEFRKTMEFIRGLFEKDIEKAKQDIDEEVSDEHEEIRNGGRPKWD
jgi:hypothetical protein